MAEQKRVVRKNAKAPAKKTMKVVKKAHMTRRDT